MSPAKLDDIKPWPGLKTLLRVESERQLKKGRQLRIEAETRYYIASFLESAESFAGRIRGYWGVENKVYHVRDVTQGEDGSRIRMHQLPQIFAVARNFALNFLLATIRIAGTRRVWGLALINLLYLVSIVLATTINGTTNAPQPLSQGLRFVFQCKNSADIEN